jgi:predicted Zn-dependent peptidase
MSFILGGGMSSRLFQTVRERHGLCYGINSFHESFDDAGLFGILTGTRPHDAVQATELSFAELRRLTEERVGADELDAAKSAMIGRLLRSTETAMASARHYAGRWRAQLPLETPDQRAESIKTVTAEDVQKVAQRIASQLDKVRLAFVSPEDQGNELLEATQR